MTFDNTNKKHQREAEKAARLADTNRIAQTRAIMSTLFGRAWMHDLLERCCMFHSPMVVGLPDATGWNIGKQDIGRQLFGDITTHCPHEYSLMMTEASTKEAANDRRNSESTSDAGSGSATPSSGRYPAQPTDATFGIDTAGFVTYASSGPEDFTERTAEDA